MMDGEPIVAKVFATVELAALEKSAEKVAQAVDDLRLPLKVLVYAAGFSMVMVSSAFFISALQGKVGLQITTSKREL